jgi:hypothetical protein
MFVPTRNLAEFLLDGALIWYLIDEACSALRRPRAPP